MGRFLEEERKRYVATKPTVAWLSSRARRDGVYKGKARAFCVPLESASENLYIGVREAALAYFRRAGIRWHDGTDGQPSNHLCDSQVCCVNFLFALGQHEAALAALLRPVVPGIRRILPMEDNVPGITFEWIGLDNYLREHLRPGASRTRGAHFTSADAAVLAELEDGTRHIVLIEWKYTESYSSQPLAIADSGTDRTAIYRHLYEAEHCPLDRRQVPQFADLFYDPFYQFMRQQLLANEMQRRGELGASRVSVLHIAPQRNGDFNRITSKALAALGPTATAVWKALLRDPTAFISVATERLFGCFDAAKYPELTSWNDYIRDRYPWVFAQPSSV